MASSSFTAFLSIGTFFPVSCGLNFVSRDALLDEIPLDALDAPFAQTLVIGCRAASIRVSFH